MKAIILYVSTHHGNTKRLAECMADSIGADLADLTKEDALDTSGYDVIGLASGIYHQSFHDALKAYVNDTDFAPHQRVFLADTCGTSYRDYTRGMRKLLMEKGVCWAGSFQCPGYDTFGIFGKIGGISKGRPSEKDLQRARDFVRRITRE